MNTAIAGAKNPVLMASASSPTSGLIQKSA
jgi:thiazole synthase ThiGH ThiG subunit